MKRLEKSDASKSSGSLSGRYAKQFLSAYGILNRITSGSYCTLASFHWKLSTEKSQMHSHLRGWVWAWFKLKASDQRGLHGRCFTGGFLNPIVKKYYKGRRITSTESNQQHRDIGDLCTCFTFTITFNLNVYSGTHLVDKNIPEWYFFSVHSGSQGLSLQCLSGPCTCSSCQNTILMLHQNPNLTVMPNCGMQWSKRSDYW